MNNKKKCGKKTQEVETFGAVEKGRKIRKGPMQTK